MPGLLIVPFTAIVLLQPVGVSETSPSPPVKPAAPQMANSPRGNLKPLGPPAIEVQAQRLNGGKLQVVFTYYAPGTAKLQRLECSGSLGDIENEVRELGKQNRMSSRVQDLVEVALRRMRDLEIPVKN